MSDGKRTYEGMFLVDAGNEFDAASEPISNVLTRYEADVLSMKPWEERRLAYEIQGRRRGLYVLTYFRADPARVTEIEHDVELDERILRGLLLRRDDLTEEQIAAATPATEAQERREAAAAEREEKKEADEKKESEAQSEDESASESDQGGEQTEGEKQEPAPTEPEGEAEGGEGSDADPSEAGEDKE